MFLKCATVACGFDNVIVASLKSGTATGDMQLGVKYNSLGVNDHSIVVDEISSADVLTEPKYYPDCDKDYSRSNLDNEDDAAHLVIHCTLHFLSPWLYFSLAPPSDSESATKTKIQVAQVVVLDAST